MIVQETADGGMLLFRQTDHALLSGAFAAAWGSDRLPAPARPTATVIAAARHDDGWAEWELAPTLDGDGRPVDFIGIPVPEHVALYRRGIDLVEREDAYAGLVVSLHGERLYTRPFRPGMDPRIEKLEGRDRDLAEDYVAYELQRQKLLGEAAVDERGGPLEAGDVATDAEECWRLLQVWDRLSLLVCMQPLTAEPSQSLPPVRGANGEDVRIEARGTPEGDLLLDPYPFARTPAAFHIEAFELDRRRFGEEREYRNAVRTAPRRVLEFRCRPS